MKWNVNLIRPLAWYKQQEEQAETHPLMQAFNGLGYVVFKRTYARTVEDQGRTEEWWETVLRVVQGAQDIGAGLTQEEYARLFDHIWSGRAFPGGRMLWQLGTDNIDRYGGDSLVNCWYTRLATIADFTWMFERLMLGGGVGFSVDNAEHFGPVQAGEAVQVPGFDADFVVPDNRHGWAQLLYRVLKANFQGQRFKGFRGDPRMKATRARTASTSVPFRASHCGAWTCWTLQTSLAPLW